jgi:hypothetical protein
LELGQSNSDLSLAVEDHDLTAGILPLERSK